jgi:predicted negative regulator of RcsB-dependent stress response
MRAFGNRNGGRPIMSRNVLYLVIAVLAVASAVIGYQLYQERQKTTGIEINVGKSGISIEKK